MVTADAATTKLLLSVFLFIYFPQISPGYTRFPEGQKAKEKSSGIAFVTYGAGLIPFLFSNKQCESTEEEICV